MTTQTTKEERLRLLRQRLGHLKGGRCLGLTPGRYSSPKGDVRRKLPVRAAERPGGFTQFKFSLFKGGPDIKFEKPKRVKKAWWKPTYHSDREALVAIAKKMKAGTIMWPRPTSLTPTGSNLRGG